MFYVSLEILKGPFFDYFESLKEHSLFDSDTKMEVSWLQVEL